MQPLLWSEGSHKRSAQLQPAVWIGASRPQAWQEVEAGRQCRLSGRPAHRAISYRLSPSLAILPDGSASFQDWQ